MSLSTTGLSSLDDEIIEFGAVVWRNGKPGEEFQAFVNPGRHLSPETTDLTGITDADLRDAPGIGEVLPKFLEFCAGRPLAAHNALFDVGFVKAACKRLGIDYRPTYLDTLPLAQRLLPDLGRYKLNLVADALELPAFRHHRAVDDARTVGYMLPPFARMLAERGITRLSEINPLLRTLPSGAKLDRRDIRHLIIFAKNQTGLRNLYRLVSYSNLRHYKYKRPLIPKSDLEQWREGLLLGSACEAGELFQAVVAGRDEDELLRLASFYDFLEIQPLANNRFMLAKGLARDDEQLRDFNRTVVHLGRLLDKPVVATGDVHFLNPEDEIFRRLLLASKGFEDCDRENPLYFHTTDEMLSEFSYLGPDAAREVVVDNPNRIADMCETLRPVPYNLFAPSIENSEEDLKALVYGKLERLYGKTPPELIVSRVETELHDIISCHYDVIYMSAQKLVQNSLENGYLVGSRGSVGSSLVAFLSSPRSTPSLRTTAAPSANTAPSTSLRGGPAAPTCPTRSVRNAAKRWTKTGSTFPSKPSWASGETRCPTSTSTSRASISPGPTPTASSSSARATSSGRGPSAPSPKRPPSAMSKNTSTNGARPPPRRRKPVWRAAAWGSSGPPDSTPADWWSFPRKTKFGTFVRCSTRPTTRTPTSSPPTLNTTAWRTICSNWTCWGTMTPP